MLIEMGEVEIKYLSMYEQSFSRTTLKDLNIYLTQSILVTLVVLGQFQHAF